MKERSFYKNRGKIAFKRNYLICVLVALVLMIFTQSDGSSYTVNHNSDENYSETTMTDMLEEQLDGLDDIDKDFNIKVPLLESSKIGNQLSNYTLNHLSPIPGIRTILGGALSVMVILGVSMGILLTVFVFNIIDVGGRAFFLHNADEKAEGRYLLAGFQSGYYLNTVKTMFLMKLKLLLWTLLLVIPGIVKGYEYRMIPYLLADHPELESKEAFQMSKEMMQGNKLSAFVLDLSFIGWHILSAITLNLVGILYVNPYQHATNAELYLDLKNKY